MRKQRTREERHWWVLHYLFVIISVLLVAGFLAFIYSVYGLFRLRVGHIIFHFDNMLVILIASIVGFIPAMFSFLALFMGSIIIDIGRAYTVFVYLIAAIVSFAAVRGRWYSQDARRLWLLSPLLAFILGDVQMILASLANEQGISIVTAGNILYFFLGELPECSLAVLITYLFLIKAPDWIRDLSWTGRLYMARSESRDHRDMFAQFRASKLSRSVTGFIALEGIVLCIAASAFANALLPSVGEAAFSTSGGSFLEDIMTFNEGENVINSAEDLEELIRQGQKSVVPGDNSIDEKALEEPQRDGGTEKDSDEALSEGSSNGEKEDGVRRHHRRRFVLNRVGIAFDIKLIMLLMNMTIPFIALANLFAQRLLVVPIIQMSSSIHEFCDVPQEEKEAKLVKIRSMKIFNDDEIGELYLALSQMATNIVAFVDEEREKEKLAADLIIAQKTSENKSNFLSNVSHELRTPINAVLGLDEMILRESRDETIIEYATDIQNAGKTLLGLVNDILDSSKLEEGKMELIPTEYELSSLINDLINMISVKAHDKNLGLEIHVDEETPHILYGDEIRLKQVILNILTNAVKYTEEGTVTMDVGFDRIDEECIFLKVRVVDTGIGIKKEDLDKLYSRFERIEEDRNKSIEGTGLGMNIVRQLLALMDSELQVDSVYGEGSDFHFSVHQRVIKWQPIGNFSETYKQFVAGNVDYEAYYIAPDAHILVVDDTPLNLTVVKGLLKETEVKVDTASSGAEALEKVEKYKYDIIFMDQRMPEMDGIETFHAMQHLTEEGRNLSAEAPVIMLTANAVSGSREQFLKEGFIDYLSKPIDPLKLEQTVRDYLAPEKVLDPRKVRAERRAADSGAGDTGLDPDEGNDASQDSTLVVALKGLASIDYEAALKNCGSEELILQVLKDYLEAIPGRSTEIRNYWERKDYENYTILVHALKSSSRLLGATQLSEDAAYLEQCGDAAQGGDAQAMEEIEKKTEPLIKLYRSYYDKLMPLISNEEEEDLRPEIAEEELTEAMSAIREFAEAFDFDSADGVMAMLKDYKIPENYAERFKEVRQALSDVDRDALLKLL